MSTAAIRAARALIPAECRVRSTPLGVAYFARDIAIWLLATGLLVVIDHGALVVLLWGLAALATSALFVVGHDAAHGALVSSPRLNATLARLALLPSLHALSAWQAGHNRVHHGHTGRAGIDFVWHPLAPSDFAALAWPWRLLHRLEWSAWGGGVYYLRAVWWARMMRLAPPARFRAAFRRDRLLVMAFALAASAACIGVGAWRAGTLAGAASTWLRALVVPWLLFNWIIGVTVYLHHIAPGIPWHTRATWTAAAGQIDGTTMYAVPGWLNVFWHNVYLHVPHHLDVGIPFYHLPRAARALAPAHVPPPRRLRWRDYVAVTRRCKLFDFERGQWLTYPAYRVHHGRDRVRTPQRCAPSS